MIGQGIRGLRRAARWLKERLVRKGLILMYHRIAEVPTDPLLLAVTPAHFAEHLEVLRKEYRPVSLQRVRQAIRGRGPLRYPVAITFDDGYADNLYQAKPLLERHCVPATCFVTTGFLGAQRELWADELERLFLQPGKLPQTLCFDVGGKRVQEDLGDMTDYRVADHHRDAGWNVMSKTFPTRRQQVFLSLYALLRGIVDKDRVKALEELRTWAGAAPMLRKTHRILAPDEVLQLAQGDLVEVGAHTVTHPVLSDLSVAEQEGELRGSKTHLERILQRPVSSFAYPFGGRQHYSARTVGLVREAGFARACANCEGTVRARTDQWQLPRFMVLDCDGDKFAKRLKECLQV